MAIGNIFLGTVKRFREQQIETKFSVIILPLYPQYSVLVLPSANSHQKTTVPIKLHRQSVIAGYLRSLLVVGSIAAICLAIDKQQLVFIIVAALLTLASLYMLLLFGRTTKAEMEERTLLKELTGLAAKAEWFEEESCRFQYEAINDAYKSNYSNNSWQGDLSSNNVNFQKIPLLYGLALFNAALYPSKEGRAMRNKAQMLYAAMKKAQG